MTDRELMTMALEAIEWASDRLDPIGDPCTCPLCAAEIALHMRLAREERPCTCHPDDNPPIPCAKQYALAQCREEARKEQEPVAVVSGYYAGRCVIEPLNKAMVMPDGMALYTAPQPTCPYVRSSSEGTHWCALAEQPAVREWQGLTEPELHEINPTWPAPEEPWGYENVLAFTRAIEAKLKEKNA